MKKIDELCINTIRMLSADAVQKANSGHPGMPMGDAAMAYVLWNKFLRHNPKNPFWPNRDRFVLSAGHGSMLLYSLLHLTGHNVSLKDLKNFRQWGSKTPGHPEYCPECAIEMTTGPLGQGFATGVGMAIAEKYLAGHFNRSGFRLVDHHIYGIVSDGDLMEGISSEAASLAGHMKLGKIVYLYSDNRITIEGSTGLAFTEDVGRRFKAYKWHVQHVDGNDLKAVEEAIKAAKDQKAKPSIIIARTHIGYGSPHKQDTAGAHGAPIGEQELKLTKKSLGWPAKKFHVPAKTLTEMRKAVAKGKRDEAKWKALFKRYAKKHKGLSRTWDDALNGRLPEGLNMVMPSFKPADGKVATRKASGIVLNAIAADLPMLIGGSADLAPSNNTYLNDYPDICAGKRGRNIHFGVREHAMGAVLNGMALSAMLIPYGGTFLIFSDYMRPAMRIAALMGVHTIYVFTHDSIGLGEDGPTHQPIEHLMSLRAMPNMTVLRPADANETVEAWKVALSNKSGPVCLALSRQGLPVLDRKKYASASGLKRGAYILSDSKGRTPELIIIASGAEVHASLAAAEALHRKGRRVRVVNMASFELFDAQSRAYRDKVLPPNVTKRLAVEAGATQGWYKYVGPEGAVKGIDRFGESAPASVIFEKFGFTAGKLVKEAEKLLNQ